MKYQHYWEKLRIDICNGYLADASQELLKSSKKNICFIVLEAITDHYNSLPKDTIYSGDILDLIDLLKQTQK